MQFTRFLATVAGISLVSASSVAPKNFNDTAPIAASARVAEAPLSASVRADNVSANGTVPLTSFASFHSYAPMAANVTEGPSSYVTVETIVTPTVIGNHTFFTTSLHTVTICTRCEEESRLREMVPTTTVTICDEVCQTLKSVYQEVARTTTIFSCPEESPAVVHTYVSTICDEVCQSIMSKASASFTTTTRTIRPVVTHVTTVKGEPVVHTTSTVRVTPKSTLYTTVETKPVVKAQSSAPAQVQTRSMIQVQTVNGASAKQINGAFAVVLAAIAVLL